MPQWQYDKIDLNNVPAKADDVDFLNDAGKEGWELVIITRNNIAYMKRQLNDGQEIIPPVKSTARKARSPHT